MKSHLRVVFSCLFIIECAEISDEIVFTLHISTLDLDDELYC